MPPTFKERTSGREPSGRFGIDLAEYSRTYVLEDASPDGSGIPIDPPDLVAWIKAVTGYTLPGPIITPAVAETGGAGSIYRVPPMCDPMTPSLFADVPTVRVVQGEDYSEASFIDDEENPIAVAPIVPGYAKYRGYEFDVPFSTRPYAVLPNSRMTSRMGEFYDLDGVRKYLVHYPEYGRYCSFFFEDHDSRVSASAAGGMTFRKPTDDALPAAERLVDKTMPAAIPDMVIPDQRLIIRWHQVPARYLSSPNSYLIRYKGCINQWDFCTRIPGSLLYMGAKIIRFYTPPQFEISPQPPDFDGFEGLHAGSFYAEPLVDLELSFIYTMRRRHLGIGADPDAVPALERPNKNWIDAPHNWMPHFATRRFFYVHATTMPDPDYYLGWMPYYFSIPHQILFQDPDVPGLIITPP